MNSIFKVLCDDSRYNIFVYLIKNGETCVCKLEELLNMKQANISKHLMRMRSEGIVKSRREGKYLHYQITEDFMRDNEDLISYINKRETRGKIGDCKC